MHRLLTLEITPKLVIYSFIFLFFLVFLILILIPESNYTKTDINHTIDLDAFMTGASAVRDGRVREIYNQELQKTYEYTFFTTKENVAGLLAFRALPITAYIYLPLIYLNPITAFWVQVTASLIFLFLTIWVLNKSFHPNSEVFWLCTSTILFFLPVFNVLRNGQLSIFLLFIFSLSIYYFGKAKYFLSGALLGLMFLKVNLLALVPFLFFIEYLQNKWSLKQLVAGFFLASLIVLGINILLYGPRLLMVYPKFLLTTENTDMGTDLIQNFNPIGILSIITNNKTYILTGALILVITLAILFLFLFRKVKNPDLLYATAAAISVLLNFHTMSSDLVFLIFAIYLISNYYFSKAKKRYVGWWKSLGVIFLFHISIWMGAYKLQSIATIILLLFFYLTLRGSIKKAV